jgi:hypothetical protein
VIGFINALYYNKQKGGRGEVGYVVCTDDKVEG